MKRKYTTLPYTEEWVQTGSFDTSRKNIDRIVIHTMIGTTASATATFQSTKGTSAHYGVSYNGNLTAYLEEYYTAYHAGNYAMNQRSIGIEHEDMGNYTAPRPDSLYDTSSKLVADICKFYKIPCDREHIIKHNQVVATGCPHNLDIDRIVRQAKDILNGVISSPPNMDDPRAGWFDLLSKTEFGNRGWETLSDEEVKKWVNELPDRKVAGGKWDVVCDKVGLPHTSSVDEVLSKASNRTAIIKELVDSLIAWAGSLK